MTASERPDETVGALNENEPLTENKPLNGDEPSAGTPTAEAPAAETMAEEADTAPNDGLPEAEFAALLKNLSAAAPLLGGLLGKGGGGPKKEGKPSREALIAALRPYLSPARREAADYLLRLARVSDALRALR